MSVNLSVFLIILSILAFLCNGILGHHKTKQKQKQKKKQINKQINAHCYCCYCVKPFYTADTSPLSLFLTLFSSYSF